MFADLGAFLRAVRSPGDFYHTFNRVYEKYCGEYLMLHFPFHRQAGEDLLAAQRNLTDHCIERVMPATGSTMLEVGCGNGIQALYVYETRTPARMIGLDLNAESIGIANGESRRRGHDNAQFVVGDAQQMEAIDTASVDILFSIESALHYPDKSRFLTEVERVLTPGGRFVIADLLTTRTARKGWEERMSIHNWTLAAYLDYFESSGLSLDPVEEITPQVVEGFRNYRSWFSNYSGGGFGFRVMTRLWAFGFVLWMLRLFSTIRTYHVFSGTKPV